MLKELFTLAKKEKTQVVISEAGLSISTEFYTALAPVTEIKHTGTTPHKTLPTLQKGEEFLATEGNFIITNKNTVIEFNEIDNIKINVGDYGNGKRLPDIGVEVKEAAEYCTKDNTREYLRGVNIANVNGLMSINATEGYSLYGKEIATKINDTFEFNIHKNIAEKLDKDAIFTVNGNTLHIQDKSGLIYIIGLSKKNYLNTSIIFNNALKVDEKIETNAFEWQSALKPAKKDENLIMLVEQSKINYLVVQKELVHTDDAHTKTEIKTVNSFGEISISRKDKKPFVMVYDSQLIKRAVNTFDKGEELKAYYSPYSMMFTEQNGNKKAFVLPIRTKGIDAYKIENVKELIKKYTVEKKAEPKKVKTEKAKPKKVEPERVKTEEKAVPNNEIAELVKKYNIRLVKKEVLKADLNGLSPQEFKVKVISKKPEILEYLRRQ